MESLLEEIADVSPNYEIRKMNGSEHEELVKFVKDKVCTNGDHFCGFVDGVTGELISGNRVYVATQECYDGTFLHGERHGVGVCTNLSGEGKFIGTFLRDSYDQGTLITKTYTYVGLFSAGVFHGLGTLVYSDGSLYEGMFEGGVFSGKGTFVNSKGDRYEGSFLSGMKHGHGKITYFDGSTYIGDWKSDRKDGVGKHNYGGKREYEGEYVNDQRHGKGKLTTPSAILVGPWRNGRPLDGPGWTIRYPKAGVKYVGDAIACRPHGQGVLSFLDQDSSCKLYEGEVVCGLRHGLGHYVAYTGTVGSLWRKDDPLILSENNEDGSLAMWKGDGMARSANDGDDHRKGSLLIECKNTGSLEPELADTYSCESNTNHISPPPPLPLLPPPPPQPASNEPEDGVDVKMYPNASGAQCVGTEVEGLMEGQGSIRFLDGSKYTGSLMGGMMHGRGTFHDAINETDFVGDFFHSLKHGHGEEEHADGSVYVGPFVNGIRSGDDGCLYKKTPGGRSLIYRGQWTNNTMTGQGKYYELLTPCKGFYSGKLQDGKRHGRGTFTSIDGHKFEGAWVEDAVCDGDWVITFPEGAVYYGSAFCRHGIPVPDGLGSRLENDGTFYSGGFRMGQRHGNGMCIFSSGVQWDGRWEDGIYVKYSRSQP
jgi:hypothetical protein